MCQKITYHYCCHTHWRTEKSEQHVEPPVIYLDLQVFDADLLQAVQRRGRWMVRLADDSGHHQIRPLWLLRLTIVNSPTIWFRDGRSLGRSPLRFPAFRAACC